MQLEFRNRSPMPWWIEMADCYDHRQALRQTGNNNRDAVLRQERGRRRWDPSGNLYCWYFKLNTICAKIWINTIMPIHTAWVHEDKIPVAQQTLRQIGIGLPSQYFLVHSALTEEKPYPTFFSLRLASVEQATMFKLALN